MFIIGITSNPLNSFHRIKEGGKNQKETLILSVIKFLFQANCVESKRVVWPPGEQTLVTNGTWTEGFYLTLDSRLLTLSTHSKETTKNKQLRGKCTDACVCLER